MNNMKEHIAISNSALGKVHEFLVSSQDKLVVVDNSLDEACFDELISNLLDCKELSDVEVSLKSCSTARKCKVIKKVFETKVVFNRTVLANIINLLKAYNSFADDYFNADTVFFIDIEEFLDVKIALDKEIQAFVDELAGYYLSLFLQVHMTSVNYLEKYVEIPMVFYTMLLSLDLYTISGICQKASKDNVKICNSRIYNAQILICQLFDKWKVTNELLRRFSEQQK